MLLLRSHLVNLSERGICLRIKILPNLFDPPPFLKNGATNSNFPEPVNLCVQTKCQNESWQDQNLKERKCPDHRSH